MADLADIAHEVERFNLEHRLATRRRHYLPVTGFCYNCHSGVTERLFCDGDCREDYEKREYFLHMKCE
ncbi:Uncharacterised protein [Citrobacter freundii]|nr:Uncharacterised protein [Citrobacter freundii]